VPEYQHLTNDEFLQIAEEQDRLTDEDGWRSTFELSRRRLSSADVRTYRRGRKAAEHAEDLPRARSQYISFKAGLGKKFFAKSNRRRDPDGQFEQYDSTLWFVVLWFPVFPIATYTVRRTFKRWLRIDWAGDEVASKRHPRDWRQILLTSAQGDAIAVLAYCDRSMDPLPPSIGSRQRLRYAHFS